MKRIYFDVRQTRYKRIKNTHFTKYPHFVTLFCIIRCRLQKILFFSFFPMKHTLLIPIIVALGVMASQAQAADVIIRGTNLGSCTTYSDGCNDHTIKNGVDTQTTDVQCLWQGVPKCLDTVKTDDTQIVDLEKNKQETEVKTLSSDFKLKSFNSCDNMEGVMKSFIKDYYEAHPYNAGYF